MTKISKRIASLFLAAIMVATMLPTFALTASAADLSALTSAISAYENAMSSGTVYKNMSAAYNAYVAANKAYDAVYYGDATNIDVDAVASDLTTATATMTSSPWTASKASGTVMMLDDTSAIDSTYATNILYASKGEMSIKTDSGNVLTYMSTSKTAVFLYDGTEIRMPVMFAFHNDTGLTGSSRKIYCYYPTDGASSSTTDNAYFALGDNWHGYYGKTKSKSDNTPAGLFVWSTAFNATNTVCKGLNKSTKTTQATDAQKNNNSYLWWAYSNYLKYVGGDSNFTDGLFATTLGWYSYSGYKVGGNEGNHYIADAEKYYIIDYTAPVKAINSKKSYLSKVTSYKEGGLSSLMSAFDEATIDPTIYDYSSNTADLAKLVAKKLATGASDLNSATATDDSANYATLRTAITNAKQVTDSSSTEYTSKYSADSISNYNDVISQAKSVMSDVYSSGYTQGTKAQNIAHVLNDEKSNILNPLVSTAELSTAISSQTSVLNAGIFDGNSQKYTYSSWLALKNAISTASSALESNKSGGQYATKDATYNDISYVAIDTTKDSTAKSNLDSAKTALTPVALSEIDKDKYEAFEYSLKVANAIDKEKYVDGGDGLNAKIAEVEGEAYTTLSDDEVSAYNTATGGTLTTESKLKDSKTVDEQTSALLNYINTINSDSVKVFHAEVSVQGKDVTIDSQDVPYGESFNFDIDLDDDESVTWSIQSYDYNTVQSKLAKTTSNSSSKIYGSKSISIVADADLFITVDVTKSESTDTDKAIVVQNIYGATSEIKYVDADYATISDSQLQDSTITLGESGEVEITAPTVPFYTFSKWRMTEKDDKIVLRPIYTADADLYTISVADGSISGNATLGTDKSTAEAKYDSSVTISTDIDNFVAWAVEGENGKYQVASYSPEYTFYVAYNEKFVPILFDGTDYTINGVALKADDIDSSVKDLNTDEILYQKLENKAPFISVIRTTIKYGTKADGAYSRAYVRVTEGAEYKSCGITITKGSAVKSSKISNILSTGQFVVTVSGTFTSGEDVSFAAYVDYNLEHTYNDTTSTITLRDTSSTAIAK
jgi:uncharacterized glyoxalase superfamily protein PhnB